MISNQTIGGGVINVPENEFEAAQLKNCKHHDVLCSYGPNGATYSCGVCNSFLTMEQVSKSVTEQMKVPYNAY